MISGEYVLHLSAMAPRFSAYFTYSEFNGGIRATSENFRAELSQFNGPSVVYLCGVMNSVITDWQGHWRAEAHEELVRNSFAPQFAELIIAAGRDEQNPRFVFHRQQLLFVCKQALLICPDGGGNNPLLSPHSAAMGRVLLMANDLLPKGLSPRVPTLATPDQLINVLSELIPVAEASGTYRAINKIVRSRVMFDRFLPNAGMRIHSLFEKATGISLNDYFALCFATLCRYFDLDWKKYQADAGNFLLSEHWYQTTTASPAVLHKFLTEISATPDGFRSSLKQKELENDFTCFRRRPIFQNNGNYFLIDSLFWQRRSKAEYFGALTRLYRK